MSDEIQQPRNFDRELSEIASRERETKAAWLTFKNKIQSDKDMDPNWAREQLTERTKQYDEEMKALQKQREKTCFEQMTLFIRKGRKN